MAGLALPMPPNGRYILMTDAVGMILPGGELTVTALSHTERKHHQHYARGEKVLEGIAEALRSCDCLGCQEPGIGMGYGHGRSATIRQ
jgi:hypothetical protein